MSDKEVYERITRLEQLVEDHIKLDEKRAERLEGIEDKFDTLNMELSRYRGTVGGVLLVITAVAAAIKMFGGSIAEFFTG
jgi:hypothetical protein